MFNAKPTRRLQIVIPAICAALLILAASAHAMGGEGPKIRAKPHKLMINTDTTLKGKGFPANTTIQLRECGRTSWLAPEDPCLEGNETSVVTDAKGRFQTTFHVGPLPRRRTDEKADPARLLRRRARHRRRHRQTRRRRPAARQLPLSAGRSLAGGPPSGRTEGAGSVCLVSLGLGPRGRRARSSVGQSCRLIIGRSLVRVQAGPLAKQPANRPQFLAVIRSDRRASAERGDARCCLFAALSVDRSTRLRATYHYAVRGLIVEHDRLGGSLPVTILDHEVVVTLPLTPTAEPAARAATPARLRSMSVSLLART